LIFYMVLLTPRLGRADEK